MLALGFGTIEIDHVTIMDGGSDCAAYLLHTMSKLSVHDATFAGRDYPYTGACNDGIVTGGTDVPGAAQECSINDWAGGQAVVKDTNFSGMARAYWARSSANGTIFEGNWIQGANATSPYAAIDLDGYGSGLNANRGDVVANNLIELLATNYRCGIRLNNAGGTMMYGNQFWDGSSGSYDYCIGSNVSYPSVGSSFNDVTGSGVTNGTWPSTANLIGLGLTNPTPNQTYRTVGARFDGGGAALAGPITRCAKVDFGGTITEFSLDGDQAGSATVTVKTVAQSSYSGPSSASDISNGGETVSSAAALTDATLSGWTKPLPADSVMCFTLSSPSAFTWLSANVKITAN
jgi:hypothetical protein